jgi:hypothetical protein
MTILDNTVIHIVFRISSSSTSRNVTATNVFLAAGVFRRCRGVVSGLSFFFNGGLDRVHASQTCPPTMNLGCKQCGAPLPDQFVIVASTSPSTSTALDNALATPSNAISATEPASPLTSSIDVISSIGDSLPLSNSQQPHHLSLNPLTALDVPFSAQLEQRARQAEGMWFFFFFFFFF